MATASDTKEPGPLRLPVWLGSCIFLVMIVFLLTTEHSAHVLGVAPYVLLLLCPIVHLFMHGGHGGHAHDHTGHEHHAHDEEDGDRP